MTKRNPLFSDRVLVAYSAGPVEPGKLGFVAATATDPAEILMYDRIGASMWEDGVTAKDVITALAAAGDGPVRVRINSPGGDVFEGLAIYNALLAHKGAVETVVDGIAASIASVIALAGSTMTMQAASMYMIHNSRTIAYGDRQEMIAAAGVMEKIDSSMAAIYAAKTGKPATDMAAAMNAETWYTSAEAEAAGFTNAILPAPKRDAPAQASLVAEIVAPAPPDAPKDYAADRRRRLLRAAGA